MFRLTYTAPDEIQGTIELSKPVTGLGPRTDIHGKRWDIRGIIGDYVQAVPYDEIHPHYSDTSGAMYGFVQQTWRPYRVVVSEGEGE